MMHKSRKNLSTRGLLSKIKVLAKELPNQVKGNRKDPVRLVDCIMSALAVFGLKYPSLLAFDRSLKNDPRVVYNLKTLYFVKNVPSDTYMRERLDIIAPKSLRKFFTSVFSQLQRGKALEDYKYMNDCYLLALDGTGIFESKSVSCENCCQKNHRDNTKTYYHNILAGALVHPSMKTVIPFAPEAILKEDGQTKNGSEHHASRRFIDSLQKEHPHLKLIILGDSLYSKGPFIKQLQKAGYQYILNAKPGDHKSLFEFIKGICKDHKTKRDGKSYHYRYANNIPLNDANQDISVNFLECTETTAKGSKTFTWITNITITEDNIHQLMKGGRSRWKIENETFNTLKNQGYQFEHNFGHGKKNLSTIFAMLMMLAFLVDQAQEQCDALFQAALKKRSSKRSFWEKIRGLFFNFLINSWEDLWKGIAYGHNAPTLTHDTG